MAFSFPYPVQGAVKRPAGQGCKSCVHRGYCPAMYWARRYGSLEQDKAMWTEPNDNVGVRCASWSNNIADQVNTSPTEDDLNENEYIAIQGLGSEADRSGITTPTTGTSRRP